MRTAAGGIDSAGAGAAGVGGEVEGRAGVAAEGGCLEAFLSTPSSLRRRASKSRSDARISRSVVRMSGSCGYTAAPNITTSANAAVNCARSVILTSQPYDLVREHAFERVSRIEDQPGLFEDPLVIENFI